MNAIKVGFDSGTVSIRPASYELSIHSLSDLSFRAMNILIIEDEYPAAERLQKLLRQIDPTIEVVAVLESVSEGKTWFAHNPPVDLILSDI